MESSGSVSGLLSLPDASTRKMFEAMEPLQFSHKDLDFGREFSCPLSDHLVSQLEGEGAHLLTTSPYILLFENSSIRRDL